MRITVELQGYLDQYAPTEAATFPYEMPDGATVADVMKRLHLPEDLSAAAIVGGEASDPTQPLNDGDRLTLVPPLGGGA
ncbi:MAG TPA: MoaD/ThiS family protein [Dehalococcoidia bacterium]|nr:MoaD/ThiS family protein [Dehalococcoidia bacterium]